MKYKTCDEFLTHVAKRNPGQPEFLQAVTEVMASLWPFIADHSKYAEHGLLDRLVEPERAIQFRVSWVDDHGQVQGFPSGHAGAATGLYFTLALLAMRIPNPALRRVVVGVCLAIPLLVATARVYRGMHHVTDVLVGVLNGLVAALLAWCWLRRSDRSQ